VFVFILLLVNRLFTVTPLSPAAFSTAEEIESMWFLQHGNLPVLSPEQILDCDTVDQGCNGGDTVTAYAYVQSAGGLETDADYPYTGDGESCQTDSSEFVASITGFEYATPPCNDTCDNQDESTLQSNPLLGPFPFASMPKSGRSIREA
jgi:hypothetical protein